MEWDSADKLGSLHVLRLADRCGLQARGAGLLRLPQGWSGGVWDCCQYRQPHLHQRLWAATRRGASSKAKHPNQLWVWRKPKDTMQMFTLHLHYSWDESQLVCSSKDIASQLNHGVRPSVLANEILETVNRKRKEVVLAHPIPRVALYLRSLFPPFLFAVLAAGVKDSVLPEPMQ